MSRQLFAAVLLVLATLLSGQAQSAPTLRFASPTDETYASGLVVLRVVVDGDSAASLIEDVTFFADGRQVCVVRRASAHHPRDSSCSPAQVRRTSRRQRAHEGCRIRRGGVS